MKSADSYLPAAPHRAARGSTATAAAHKPMLDESEARRRLIAVLGIAAFIYTVLVLAFYSYEVWKGERDRLHHQTIAKCLDSGGHIGPGVTCRRDEPSDNKTQPEVLPD